VLRANDVIVDLAMVHHVIQVMDSDDIVHHAQCRRDTSLDTHGVERWKGENFEAVLEHTKDVLNNILEHGMP
jgi:hypothetical protein